MGKFNWRDADGLLKAAIVLAILLIIGVMLVLTVLKTVLIAKYVVIGIAVAALAVVVFKFFRDRR